MLSSYYDLKMNEIRSEYGWARINGFHPYIIRNRSVLVLIERKLSAIRP